MAMAVVITNITDAAKGKKSSPQRLAIYTTHLDPGESLKLPANLVDARLRKLEKEGLVAIGQLPSWYAASKSKKLGRKKLTTAELKEKFAKKRADKAAKEARAAKKAAAPSVVPDALPVTVTESPFKKKKRHEGDVPATEDKDKKFGE